MVLGVKLHRNEHIRMYIACLSQVTQHFSTKIKPQKCSPKSTLNGNTYLGNQFNPRCSVLEYNILSTMS